MPYDQLGRLMLIVGGVIVLLGLDVPRELALVVMTVVRAVRVPVVKVVGMTVVLNRDVSATGAVRVIVIVVPRARHRTPPVKLLEHSHSLLNSEIDARLQPS